MNKAIASYRVFFVQSDILVYETFEHITVAQFAKELGKIDARRTMSVPVLIFRDHQHVSVDEALTTRTINE